MSNVLSLFNNWFDLLNTRMAKDGFTNSYGLDIENQNILLNKMTQYIKDMRVHGSKSLMPFQKGIIITNKSFQNLFNDLQSEYDIKYIISRRLNQDGIEAYFSYMRGMGGSNDHPTPLDFKYR